jgi:peroxiredoxin
MLNRENAPAVDFNLADTAENAHTLAEFKGRWLLLVFHRHLG